MWLFYLFRKQMNKSNTSVCRKWLNMSVLVFLNVCPLNHTADGGEAIFLPFWARCQQEVGRWFWRVTVWQLGWPRLLQWPLWRDNSQLPTLKQAGIMKSLTFGKLRTSVSHVLAQAICSVLSAQRCIPRLPISTWLSVPRPKGQSTKAQRSQVKDVNEGGGPAGNSVGGGEGHSWKTRKRTHFSWALNRATRSSHRVRGSILSFLKKHKNRISFGCSFVLLKYPIVMSKVFWQMGTI